MSDYWEKGAFPDKSTTTYFKFTHLASQQDLFISQVAMSDYWEKGAFPDYHCSLSSLEYTIVHLSALAETVQPNTV